MAAKRTQKKILAVEPVRVKVKRIWFVAKRGLLLVRRVDDNQPFYVAWEGDPPAHYFEVEETALQPVAKKRG